MQLLRQVAAAILRSHRRTAHTENPKNAVNAAAQPHAPAAENAAQREEHAALPRSPHQPYTEVTNAWRVRQRLRRQSKQQQ
ncbi:MAG TPA: hypothetical protein VJ836_00985 [Candidatus Saccharimonadales bacterium]|nr:hypothetical protein [Candidatus Saccharimonadales bacterium]